MDAVAEYLKQTVFIRCPDDDDEKNECHFLMVFEKNIKNKNNKEKKSNYIYSCVVYWSAYPIMYY